MSGSVDHSARLRRGFWFAWLALVGLKLTLALHLEPYGDEVFYAWEGRHLALAYSDLPGLTAWLTRLGTEVAGYSALGMRWPFLLIGALLPVLVVRIAARWFGADNGWRAGLLALPLPVLLPAGIYATPEAPLLFAFLLCLDASAQLLRRVSTGACLQLALGLALGALCHYRFAPLMLGGGLGLLLAGGLPLLRDPRLLLAILVGICAWLPLLLYNLSSDAAGIAFQLVDRHPWSFDPRGLLLPVIQALVTTPVLYGLCLWALWQSARRWRAEPHWRLILLSAGLPLLLYTLLAAFADRARVSAHWPLPAYLVLVTALPTLLSEQVGALRARFWLILAQVLAWLGTLLLTAVLVLLAVPSLSARLAGHKLYPDNFVGAYAISERVAMELGADDLLVADHFKLAGQLAFLLQRPYGVYSLDSYLNHKHGRARQLADWGYDEAGLAAATPGQSVLVVMEPTEQSRHRQQPWLDTLCRRFEDLHLRARVLGPGGGKLYLIYRGRLRAQPGEDCPEPLPGLPPMESADSPGGAQ